MDRWMGWSRAREERSGVGVQPKTWIGACMALDRAREIRLAEEKELVLLPK